jgi:hypothetical protein
MTDKTQRYAFHKPFTIRLHYSTEWDFNTVPLGKRGLMWYMGASKKNGGTGAGVHGHGTQQRFRFSLRRYITVFQAQGYAFKTRVDENIKRGYR